MSTGGGADQHEGAFDGYADLSPIRSRGAFHLLSARRTDTDAPCILVTPGPHAEARRAEEALLRAAKAHERIDHPAIPKTAFAGQVAGRFLLELACDAVLDGAELLRLVSDSGRKVPYDVADTIMVAMREVCQAGHRTLDDAGNPLCLGTISYGNVLYARDGKQHLVGFGHNFVTSREDGTTEGWSPVFQAPEVTLGVTPSPEGDYIAIVALGRSLMSYLDLPGALASVIRGELRPSASALFEGLQWFQRRMFGEPPQTRPSIAEGVAMANKIRDILGTSLSPEKAHAFVANLLDREHDLYSTPSTEPSATTDGAVVVGPEADWLETSGGERHRLGGRRALRRVLLALTSKRIETPGTTLSTWELFEAGWPGESPVYEAALNRVYVTMNRLRALGLREIIERVDDGYRFSPRTNVRLSA